MPQAQARIPGVPYPAASVAAPGEEAPSAGAPASEAPAAEAPAPASEAPAGDAGAGGDAGASAGGSFSVGGGAAPAASGDASADAGAGADKGKKKKKGSDSGEKPMRKYRPTNNMFELGIFGGVMFPSDRHELFNAQTQLDMMDMFFQEYKKVAPEFGARFGYYPFSFIGGEIEGGVMPTKTVVTDERALLFNFRAHLVGQIPFWRIVPFIVWGGGLIGTTGALGNDVDESTHFGGGVKFFINDLMMLRLDIRDVVAARYRVDAGATNYPEILLGLSFTLNRKKKLEEPDKDSDGDGFLDSEDACPYTPGIAPDGCPEKDRDGDGFLDSQDACPDTPGIAPDGCPEKDRDGDGILDSQDKCPDTPGVPPDGCPIPDTDGDGILDLNDKCVTEPETRNGYEDEDGCPDEIPEQVNQFTGVIRGIYFDLNKDTIKPKSKPVLDRAVDVLKEFPSINIEISGHTDSTGSYEYNKDLSQRRANSVKRYLNEAGIEDGRITTRGAGPDEPIDTNKTAAGRAKNRRIVFTILVQ
ncbi:MAG: OmpA family protein [Myxococcales bacterium]|nr:OmpA family protein [Myxococcales bacterium]